MAERAEQQYSTRSAQSPYRQVLKERPSCLPAPLVSLFPLFPLDTLGVTASAHEVVALDSGQQRDEVAAVDLTLSHWEAGGRHAGADLDLAYLRAGQSPA